MKKFWFLLLAVTISVAACADLKKVASDMMVDQLVSNKDIADALKLALRMGIDAGADKLSLKDGYYKSAAKILLPAEVRQVTDKLKMVPGFSDFENVLLEKVNRSAEDAAKGAKPIFQQAIREMTFEDATKILMGADNSATQYLNSKTNSKLYAQFNPIIKESLNKFNAIQYWKSGVDAYNKIPLVQKINPSLDDYVTKEALNGLFNMVANKEKEIRTNKASRTTDLLRKVFAKQD
ncbi:MAG: DUF4197 domain-containing protein [Saprospiraceae bacterium]|nr:DUF4197 domain-containing protein [Saprospiraceae bacterium]MBP7699298.1 DUF4197 domain-containing protein [Saprospiraceae bacterium]